MHVTQNSPVISVVRTPQLGKWWLRIRWSFQTFKPWEGQGFHHPTLGLNAVLTCRIPKLSWMMPTMLSKPPVKHGWNLSVLHLPLTILWFVWDYLGLREGLLCACEAESMEAQGVECSWPCVRAHPPSFDWHWFWWPDVWTWSDFKVGWLIFYIFWILLASFDWKFSSPRPRRLRNWPCFLYLPGCTSKVPMRRRNGRQRSCAFKSLFLDKGWILGVVRHHKSPKIIKNPHSAWWFETFHSSMALAPGAALWRRRAWDRSGDP